MKLEKLELRGFKSFADKTEFVFQPGLTAFVGPNGCGKSNIVAAIRWVLGEQSIKALRGNDMQDVIFSGAPSRRSTGLAEATLTLTNTRGLLPTDYETVSVGRRLYRSGESEYYINKQRCRLRDIRNLFMDTGIGMDAYSIIEQGKVDLLLTSNSQDRRVIFEEAAGISKYKAQKRVCLSKLERVNSNLLRLGDIIDEVEKRTRSVKYQAAKARRWKKLDDRKRELSIAVALHDYDELVRGRRDSAQKLAELNSEVGSLNATTERIEAELSELETTLIDADQRISHLESEDVRISSQARSAEETIGMKKQRISDLDNLENASKDEIAKSEAALEIMHSEAGQVTSDAVRLEQTLAAAQTELDQRRAALKDLDKRLSSLGREIDENRSRGLEVASELAKQNNELSAIDAQRQQLLRYDERLGRRASECADNLARCAEQKQQLGEQTKAVSNRLDSLKQQQHAAEQERKQTASHLEEISDRIYPKRSEIATANSRAELLRDLQREREGVGAGVRHLLEAARGPTPHLPGICGMVADLIEVNAEHAAAVEAALGPYQQLVITESFEAVTLAADFLAQGEKGKAAFLPLDAPEDPSDPNAVTPEAPGILGSAMDFMRYNPRFEKPLRYLLGDVVVVRDINVARELAATDGRGLRYATLDGQLLSPHGISVGGAASGATSVISRKSELQALDVHRAKLEADLAVLEKQREESAEKAEQAKQVIEKLTAEVRTTETELAEVRAESSKVDESISRLDSELRAGESEQAEINSNLKTLAARETEVNEEVESIKRTQAELKHVLAQQEASLARTEAERDQMRTTATELQVAQAQRTEKAESLRRRTAELERLSEERKKNLEAARKQLADCACQRSEATEAILAKKKEIGQLLEHRGKLGSEKAKASNHRDIVRAQLTAGRNERHDATRRAKEAEAKLNQLNIHAAEIAMRLETLQNRAQSEFDCSLAERHEQSQAEQRNWDEIAAEIETISQKMESMGAVNTYAIEELEDLEHRSDELTRQREDLQKAERTLKDIIGKINRRSREMFRKTFQDVRQNFQVLFRKLFGGGRADIILEEDLDILDAGIDIVACPPGKEPTSITLLSGGEKALTAVALLFAIFRSKPSPFCVLDEVDAALDESNIARFAALVREFLEDSQFLVVTHARRTMGMADVLYGITMQEPGISTKVSGRCEGNGEVAAAG